MAKNIMNNIGRKPDEMKTFFIADSHFGHRGIIEYEKRPFDTVEGE